MVALMIEAIMPPPITMPIRGSSQPAMKRADDADYDVAEQPKAQAAHDLAGQPARDRADDQNNEDCFNSS